MSLVDLFVEILGATGAADPFINRLLRRLGFNVSESDEDWAGPMIALVVLLMLFGGAVVVGAIAWFF